MAYNIITLRGALQQMGVARTDTLDKSGKPNKPFIWQADKTAVNPKLQQQFPYGRAKADYSEKADKSDKNNINKILNDLTEYCWIAYSKSFERSGPHIIGRTDDLWVPEYLERAGITDKKTQTLWDASVTGNIQLLDKWAPVVNDSWVLGGVHRRAQFELVSVRSLKNLWDFENKYHVVTAREILGLLHFGYAMTQGPASLWFTCIDVAKANAATLEEYSAFMKQQEALASDSIRSLLVVDSTLTVDPAMKKQIEGFDKSKLRHVPPPR